MMSRSRLLLFFAAVGLCAISHATSLCTTQAINSATLTGNVGCQFGDAIFYNFSYSYNSGSFPSPAVPASAVQVSFSGTALNPTVTITADWEALASATYGGSFNFGDITDISIAYSVASAVPNEFIVGAGFTVKGNFGNVSQDTSGGSGVQSTENVTLDTTAGSTELNANIFPAPNTAYGAMTGTSGYQYFSGQTQIDYLKDINILGGQGVDNGMVTEIDQSVVLVQGPEPGTYVMLGSGLIGFAFVLRKRTSKRS